MLIAVILSGYNVIEFLNNEASNVRSRYYAVPLPKEVYTQFRLLEMMDNKANFKVTNETQGSKYAAWEIQEGIEKK